ncbi:hypothetical protein F0U62_12510 [Cystobacter fuscus]|uniref:CRISPR-associated protein Cas4 n=1 Tax=Cystobacter fuscus TaxID=43 RepID=UPI002B2F3B1D|nr:hypothetical protein F0U62_12510 [Cystobacter fuscus]
MQAQDGDPWVSVSLLGECTFCVRAGRFQHEQSQEDTGEEQIEPPRRGWFRPPFSVAEIELEMGKLRPKAATLALATLVTTVLALFVCIFGVAAAVLFVFTVRAGLALLALGNLLRDARAAASPEPDPGARQPQPVSWWSLLQNGFQPHRYEDPLSDESWRVTGKPWRILQRGSVRIPVFRKRNEDERLYRQHFARIAAYAHLLERSEGATVPYGVVLLGSSYCGLAVPVDPPSKKQFHDALILARTVIKGGPHQPPPHNPSMCRSCVWGKPMTEDNGSSYQSPCGERYDWVPPHEKAIRKGLV